jgi:hypothetical protein
MYLPRQPLANEKPFFIAGLIFALLILLFIAVAYFIRQT